MNGKWFSLLILVLMTGVLFLRVRFPNASHRAETAVLAIATVAFFSLCQAFLHG